jgi:hypothetical protein
MYTLAAERLLTTIGQVFRFFVACGGPKVEDLDLEFSMVVKSDLDLRL